MESDPNTIFIGSHGTPENLIQNQISKEMLSIPKTHYGLSGLNNPNNFCYMNSAIQVLSHNYPLTSYLFTKKSEIVDTIKKNGRKIFQDHDSFQLDAVDSIVPLELRTKIQDENYDSTMLTDDESNIILNHTITMQLIRLLEIMWTHKCVANPTSFRTVFSEARNKFFSGFLQHDAEEAYSCIIQKMQEELSREVVVKFKTTRASVQDFLIYKNEITQKIQATTVMQEKKKLLDQYIQKKKEMPEEYLIIDAFREMKKYYGGNYSRITEIFAGFLHSSTNCPNCKYSSHRFDPYLHLSLPMPRSNSLGQVLTTLTIEDCMNEYCKDEVLDEKNLWNCEGCNGQVRAIKKLQIWTAPSVLVIQLKRFSATSLSKDRRLVKYPLKNFDISEYISPIQREMTKCFKYRLQSVINHTGSTGGGHYYTFCLDEDNNRWYTFNDDLIPKEPPSAIITENAYLLVYIREDMIIA